MAASFHQFSLWFSVFDVSGGGFQIFLPNAYYTFSGFGKVVIPPSGTKTAIPRDHLQLEECMPSLVSLAAIVWVITYTVTYIHHLYFTNIFRFCF